MKRLYPNYTPTNYESAHFPSPIMDTTNTFKLCQFGLKTGLSLLFSFLWFFVRASLFFSMLLVICGFFLFIYLSGYLSFSYPLVKKLLLDKGYWFFVIHPTNLFFQHLSYVFWFCLWYLFPDICSIFMSHISLIP